MANITIEKLNQIRNNILNGKNELSNSLHMCGLKNVKPNDNFPHDFNSENYETFGQYANYIKKLATKNSFIMEFEIPESAQTVYKRTIALPMLDTYYGDGVTLNTIADELIASDTGTYPITYEITANNNQDLPQEYYTTDYYGNKCLRGDVEISNNNTNDNIINPINYTASYTNTLDDIPMYDFEVDWGDGTTAKYTPNASYEENKKAIWHTYEKPGVYDIAINGIFRQVSTTGYWMGNYVKNGDYVRDKDNKILQSYNNYGMRNYLIEVISWGNTLFTDMEIAFRGCHKLSKIPMYDTTNSFENVTDFIYGFHACTSLTEIPFNNDTKKGLLSGCKKLKSVYGLFYDCVGITSPIPEGLIDNCENLENVSYLFYGCVNLIGSVPNRMFKGLSKLRLASATFYNCNKMNGEISDELFKDCPLIEDIRSIFFNCNQIKGRITKNIIGGLSKLTNMTQAFYGCSSLEGIDADAFYNLTSDNIFAVDAFYGCSGLTEIPQGLLESLMGNDLYLARMFANCVNIRNLSLASLSSLKVKNAIGMFSSCKSLVSEFNNVHSDWDDYSTIQKWYGIFANCKNMINYNNVPIELGGNGKRKFSDGKVGMIMLNNGEFIEFNHYDSSYSSTPIGFVYADLFLDEDKCISTILDRVSNLANDETVHKKHVILLSTFNDMVNVWTKNQPSCENIPTIMDTGDRLFGYNLLRFNGEAYTKAVNEWRVEKGYAIKDEDNNYIAQDSDIYNCFDDTNKYNIGLTNIHAFIGDVCDYWLLFLLNQWLNQCCEHIYNVNNNFNEQNCYALTNRNSYWCSNEVSTNVAGSNSLIEASISNKSKYFNGSVRPVFSIKL